MCLFLEGDIVDSVNLVLKKYLKKKKEIPLFQLMITNYNKSNFYFAIVYNAKVEAYKVLFLPLDIVDLKHIDDYSCYQFINYSTVNYILDVLNEDSKLFESEEVRFKNNKKIKNYQIEIDVKLADKNYLFKATRYIPKEWIYLFDVIVTLFEHAPHIVSELCEDILVLFRKENEFIPFQESFEFKLLRGDVEELDKKIKGKKISYDKITYLEKVEDKYFSIIDKHLVIIEYTACDIINTYCDTDDYYDYIYTVIMAIRDDVLKKFSKITLTDKKEKKVQYYLCSGLEDKNLKVIHGYGERVISLDKYTDKSIKFIDDEDGKMEKRIKDILKK